MEVEVISELDAPTDTTVTEAVNEGGEPQRWWGGRTITITEATGGRRRQRKERTDSDVADNKPRHMKEAMHRKEGPNLKLTNNKQPHCTDRRKTTNVANLQRGGRITQTQREVSCKTRKRLRTDSVSNHYGDKGQVGDMYMYGTR